jgi:hypothetical protein
MPMKVSPRSECVFNMTLHSLMDLLREDFPTLVDIGKEGFSLHFHFTDHETISIGTEAHAQVVTIEMLNPFLKKHRCS